jgi:hypothetical protein
MMRQRTLSVIVSMAGAALATNLERRSVLRCGRLSHMRKWSLVPK